MVREEEERTNPICFKLSSALFDPSLRAVNLPSDVESVDSFLDIALLTCWDTFQRELS